MEGNPQGLLPEPGFPDHSVVPTLKKAGPESGIRLKPDKRQFLKLSCREIPNTLQCFDLGQTQPGGT